MCEDWKEWQGDARSKLKYEYRVRPLGSKRSLLFYFGHEASSNPAVFPVGNYRENFYDECVLLVYDSIGDFWELIQLVTVN